MIIEYDSEQDLMHYGVLRKSGRYPWGSGKTQYARNRGFLDYVKDLEDKGLTQKEIADGLLMHDPDNKVSIANLRDAKTVALNQNKLDDIHQIEKLREKGVSNPEIARIMGKPGESSIRALSAPGVKEKIERKFATTKMLQEQVEKHGVIDVGRGVEAHLNISAEQLRTSVGQLREQGYEYHLVGQPQAATPNDTQRKVLALPGITQNEVWRNRSTMIKQIDMVTGDDGASWVPKKRHELVSIDPSRVHAVFKEDGGDKADGMIYVRPGVPDVSIGKNAYAQVRVKIGEDHFLKGMAMYKEGLPKGKDIEFHSAKEKTSDNLDNFKKLTKENKDYPFDGAIAHPQIIDEGKPTERVVSAMNLVNKEGDWKKWSRSISAQALSKQAPSLAKEQLDITYKARKKDYDEIMALTNPVVKAKLLEAYADATDKSAVHLKAAGLERQNWHVILPVNSMKPNEIYAPKYNNGETVVLIRYPHGGTFEIPELKVNNRHKEAKELLGPDPKDAVGIHHSVAERLSGADFDGDTVLVIPNNSRQIKTTPALAALKGFDPKALYKLPHGVKFSGNKQQEMGKVSNLITDMTLLGASHEEIARAVKHSMVVIDAEKHDLDHKKSYQDFGIAKLKAKYQGVTDRGTLRGASTIISRAGAEVHQNQMKPRPYGQGGPINKETGALEFVPTNRTRAERKKVTVNGEKVWVETGNRVPLQETHKRLAVEKDANVLVSVAGKRVEKIYAEHSNKLKDLANQARLSMIRQPNMVRNPSATKAYAKQVESLNSKLVLAKQNAPRERQAQALAEAMISAQKADNPDLNKSQLKKIRFQAITEARNRLGVERKPIEIDKDEWAAIQAGAISKSHLSQILDKADLEIVKQHATPRSVPIMSRADIARAHQMLGSGRYTRAEVAKALGVSVSTLDAKTIGDAEEGDS